jgi:hypothetical protein
MQSNSLRLTAMRLTAIGTLGVHAAPACSAQLTVLAASAVVAAEGPEFAILRILAG